MADADFVAGALSRLLGQHVEIGGSISFRPGAGLEVELEQIRITDPNRPGRTPRCSRSRTRAACQAWPRLLAGQLSAARLGAHRAGAATRLEHPASHFNLAALPRLGLSLVDGRARSRNLAGETWSLLGLQLEAQARAASARGSRATAARGSRAARTRSPSWRCTSGSAATARRCAARVVGLDLTALPKLAVAPRGRAAGDFEIAVGDGGGDQRPLDLEVAKLPLPVPKLSAPIAPARTHVARST